MPVFKRALNVALSMVLACPVTVWARNEKPRSRRGFVVDKAPTESRRSKPIAKREPAQAKNQNLSPSAAFASVMPKPMEKRGDFNVIEVKGKGNRLKSRTISGPDFKEIIVDEDDDGTADVYEVTRGSLTAKLYRPYRGQFTHLEYTQKRAKGILTASLILDAKTKKYILVTSSVRPYKKLLNSNKTSGAVAGAICKDDLAYLSSFEDFLKELNTAVGGEKAEALSCKLNAFQDVFFDKSCDSPTFKDSKADMIKGLSKLMSSRGSSNPSQYLQCLEDNGFGYHAAKIQSILANKLYAAKNVMTYNSTSGESGFTNNSCERQEKVEVYKSSTDESAETFKTENKKIKDVVNDESKKKLITCKADSKCWGSHTEGQINLCASSSNISKGYGISAEDAYGSVLMHELLHETGMNGNDEPLIDNIQNCCAPSKYGKDQVAAACATIRKSSEENQFIAIISVTDTYKNLVMQLSPEMGEDNAKEYLATLATAFRNKSEGQGAIRDYGTCQASAKNDEDKLAGCRQNFLNKFSSFAVPYTKNELCGAWKYTKPSFNCTSIVSTFEKSLDNSHLLRATSTTIVVDGNNLLITGGFSNDGKLYDFNPNWPDAGDKDKKTVVDDTSRDTGNTAETGTRTAEASPESPTQPSATNTPEETQSEDIIVTANRPKKNSTTTTSISPTNTYVPYTPTQDPGTTSGPTMPLGGSDNFFQSTPIVDSIKDPSSIPSRVLAAGEGVVKGLGRFVAAAPANAQTAAAKQVVASAELKSSAQSTLAKGEKMGSRVPAMGASSSLGGAGGGTLAFPTAGAVATVPEAKALAAAASKAESEGTPKPSSDGKKGERDPASLGAGKLGLSWKEGTFRTRFEAARFITKASSDQILALTQRPNSAFERDLARQQIGIQMSGGRVIGYSNPNYQICGNKIVSIGVCR